MSTTRPRISSRGQPGHVIRIDTKAGSYEEVNPPMLSSAELRPYLGDKLETDQYKAVPVAA